MADFGIRFFLCNILICIIIGILLIAKRVLRNHLTSRMQFNLWFLLLGLLAVPFIPIRPVGFSKILSLIDKWKNATSPNTETIAEAAVNVSSIGTTKQINDFALSVSSKTPSVIGLILFGIWLIGIFAMLLLVIKSNARLKTLKKSALPLQSREVRMLYGNCLNELKIKRDIPIHSTAFLKSPIIVGLFRPCIYLPIHLISDFNAADMRYMLLHELQHYKHKDAIASYLMNFFGILYWFNPLVWYALKEMRNDREVACDTSVLKILNENDYEDYGNTLINFAEKVSLTPFPFAAGISGTMRQMQKRIINISSYQKPSVWTRIKGAGIFAIIAVLLLGLTPMLSTYAAEQSYYKWNASFEKIDLIDLSAYFNGYEGSFVLYDQKNDTWSIYDMEHATLQTAPNSTYKIYDALFGLEEGIITPKDSFMAWNGADYPFEAWNADQNLYSAMQSSVNWYFQEIDRQLGTSALRSYIKEIGYGNEIINSDLSSYWMQSALKISPVEQVELLTNLYNNDFGFTPENVNAVKDSICLFSSENGSFYGKTGTGRVNDKDINGWFIGYIETADSTYFFATNIQSTENATGSNASEISFSVLSDMGIWKQ
ncbi:MAG: BlaR1 family beta-lactam sensor/signal transducer [Lachnospiraceae bacterium]|nr:BlaR1 family beta-lactam sensor/signal transducer [Lachnospiraceae bacterium]